MPIPFDSPLTYDLSGYTFDGLEVVTDWLAQYGEVVLGGSGPYGIVSITGLADQPDTATSDRDRLRRDGLHPGDDFIRARSVVLSIDVHADGSGTDFNRAVTDLQAAFRPGRPEAPFVFQIPGVAGGNLAVIFARPRKRSIPVDRNFYAGMATAQIELVATDPRVYLAEIETASTGLPTDAGGFELPLEFPLVFGAPAAGGSTTITNSGTYPTPVVFRIDGPVVNPRISNLTTDRTLDLAIALSAGEHLIIDSASRSVLLNGTASRYVALTAGSEWFDLEPGANQITFRADAHTASVLNISTRSAWV